MKKTLLILGIPLLCSFIFPGDEKKEAAEKKRLAETAKYIRNYYGKIVQNFAPEFSVLLEKNYCGPDCFISYLNGERLDWTKDTSTAMLLDLFGTVIHESTHSANGWDPVKKQSVFIAEPGIKAGYRPYSVFRSEEISRVCPMNAGDEILRFSDYVSSSSGLSSNRYGIFGLLDEFSAYNNGTRACTIAAEHALEKGDTVLADAFLGQAARSFDSWYDFRLFIGWYLLTADAYYPETYVIMQEDTALRTAFTLIEQSFSETISRLEKVSAAAAKKRGFSDRFGTKNRLHCLYGKEHLPDVETHLNAFRMKDADKENFREKPADAKLNKRSPKGSRSGA